MTAAKTVFDEIRVDPSDRAMIIWRALSNHKYLREIQSHLGVGAKLVELISEQLRNFATDRITMLRLATNNRNPASMSNTRMNEHYKYICKRKHGDYPAALRPSLCEAYFGSIVL